MKNIPFQKLCTKHHSSRLQHWLTYLVTLKQDRLGESSSYFKHTLFRDTHIYLLKPVGHDIFPLQSSHECTLL